MKSKLLLVLSALAFTVTGCSPGTAVKHGSNNINRMSSCVSGKAVDAEHLQIQGSPGAVPGQSVRYKLNENIACAPEQTISWETANGKALGDDATTAVTYRKSGQYVVIANVQEKGSMVPSQLAFKTVVVPGLALNGPQVGVVDVDNQFTLVVPAGVSITAADWNFGDSQPNESSLSGVEHAYWSAGTYTITVNVTLANGDTQAVTHQIQILPANDVMNCANQLALSGPSTVTVGVPSNYSLFIPSCMVPFINQLKWDFGSGPVTGGQNVTHTFTEPGSVRVVVGLYQGESVSPFATLSMDVVVSPNGTEEPEDPVDPEIPDPNECPMLGQTRTLTGELMTEQNSCGINGTRTDTYRNVVTQQCNLVGDIRRWVETGTMKEVVSQGQCMGQACEIPAAMLNGADPASLGLQVIGGKYYLADGASKVFYSTTTPTGACSSVSESRSCSNGVLGGSTSHTNLTCHEACPGFGQHGTVKTGVVTGSENVAKTCQYGETGIFDIYSQISDQMCKDGQVQTSNTRRGTLVTAGMCPAYTWIASERFGACSAACGGTQSRIYECRDSNGNLAPNERCGGAAPVVTRVCDGNPDSVKRSESVVKSEDASSSATCPKNQIGVVVKTRDVTITTNYACIDHKVQQASVVRSEGPWVEEKYCREYVPYRCSQDSLSVTQAKGRYQWMLKCANSVPVIKDFLEKFDKYESGTGKSAGLMYQGHSLYATFMNRATKPEKVWKAPTDANAACTVPETVYVAAVCTASCATPEQMILSQQDAGSKLAYTPIVDSWQQKFAYVATLQSKAALDSKRVVRTKVDSWVTEMMDGEHEILNFTMKSGGVIRLTPNHPVVTADGRMKTAEEFKAGESLVKVGGEADEIVSIESFNYFGKVYNLFVKSDDLQKNIVITNGYLNGTAFYQNEGAKHLNKQVLRGNLIRGALD